MPSPSGRSLRDMAQWASEVGLRSSEGNPLDRLSIRKVLSNISYTGQVGFHRRRGGNQVVNGKHLPIVDVALFAAVQGRLRDRRRVVGAVHPFGRSPYPLSGTAVCIYCQQQHPGGEGWQAWAALHALLHGRSART